MPQKKRQDSEEWVLRSIRYFFIEIERRYTRKFTETVTLGFPCVPVKNEPVGKSAQPVPPKEL